MGTRSNCLGVHDMVAWALNKMTSRYCRLQDVIAQLEFHIWGPSQKTLGYSKTQTRHMRSRKWWQATHDIMTPCHHDKVGAFDIVAWGPKHEDTWGLGCGNPNPPPSHPNRITEDMEYVPQDSKPKKILVAYLKLDTNFIILPCLHRWPFWIYYFIHEEIWNKIISSFPILFLLF